MAAASADAAVAASADVAAASAAIEAPAAAAAPAAAVADAPTSPTAAAASSTSAIKVTTVEEAVAALHDAAASSRDMGVPLAVAAVSKYLLAGAADPTPEAVLAAGLGASAFAAASAGSPAALELQHTFWTHGGTDAVIALLRATGGGDRPLGAASACRLIKDMPRNVSLYEDIGAAGGLRGLIDLISAYAAREGNSAAVLEQAGWAMRCLLRSTHNEEAAETLGVVPALVSALRRYGSNALVAAAVAFALGNACCIRACQRTLAESEGIPLIVDALRRHMARDATVNGLVAVSENLLSLETNRPLYFEAEGIPLLLEALRTHRGVTGVVEAAMNAISNATRHSASKSQLIDLGVVPLVMSIIEERHSSAAITSSAASCMWAIVLDTDARDACGEAGLRTALGLMEEHCESSRVVLRLFGWVVNMTCSHALARALVDLGGLDTVLRAIEANLADVRVVSEGTSVMWNVSGQESLRTTVARQALPLLLKAARTYPSSKEVANNVVVVLHHLTVSAGEARDIIRDNSGAIRLLRTLLRPEHGHPPATLERIRGVLTRLGAPAVPADDDEAAV